MNLILATVLCCAAIIGQISTASAYYYYGSPAGIYYLFAQPQQDLGWAYTRNQPVGDGKPYPAARMPDGTLACEHSNYRPIRGWCRRIW